MSEDDATFGSRYAGLGSVEERLALEHEHGRRQPFGSVDRVLDQLIAGAMGGERVARLVAPKTKKESDRVELLPALNDETRAAVTEHFEVTNQERRGSWYVPTDEPLSLGLIHTVHWTRHNPRLALNLADSEMARPTFAGAPEAVAVWVLEPLFEELFLPLKLRGPWLGARTPEQLAKSWKVIDPLYAALNIDPGAVSAYRPGMGWSRHTSEDVVRLRQALVESWAQASASGRSLSRLPHRAARGPLLLQGQGWPGASQEGAHPGVRQDPHRLFRRRLAGVPGLPGRGAAPQRRNLSGSA